MLDDRALLAAERLVPEDAVQCPPRLALAAVLLVPATVPVVSSMVTPNAVLEGPHARPCPSCSSPSTIGGGNDNAGRSVDNRPSGVLPDSAQCGYRTNTPAWLARSRKYCGARPSTRVTATPTAIVVMVSGDGTATVGPSSFGSLKNIRTITRM